MRLPEQQNHLIERVSRVQPNLVIVLHNGSPVEMPWEKQAKAILEMYLGGEAVGEAAADLLFGKANPSGKLAETFPLQGTEIRCAIKRGFLLATGITTAKKWRCAIPLATAFPTRPLNTAA